MTNTPAPGHGRRDAAAAAQLLDSWAWLDGVSCTPSPLGFDGVGCAGLALAQHGRLPDPLLFSPAAADLLSAPSSASSPAPSSATLDADSLLSFDMAGSLGPAAMSDAEFQMLWAGLTQNSEDGTAAAMAMPCQPFVPVADDFALRAFPSLDLFAAPMAMHAPVPVPVSVPVPAPAPAPDASQSARCRTCHRAFPTLCRLRKHENTHTRPFVCTVCGRCHAAKKDLHRHLWTHHPELAAAMGIPSPARVCPVAGCGFESRQDNVRRHVRAKHPGEHV